MNTTMALRSLATSQLPPWDQLQIGCTLTGYVLYWTVLALWVGWVVTTWQPRRRLSLGAALGIVVLPIALCWFALPDEDLNFVLALAATIAPYLAPMGAAAGIGLVTLGLGPRDVRQWALAGACWGLAIGALKGVIYGSHGLDWPGLAWGYTLSTYSLIGAGFGACRGRLLLARRNAARSEEAPTDAD